MRMMRLMKSSSSATSRTSDSSNHSTNHTTRSNTSHNPPPLPPPPPTTMDHHKTKPRSYPRIATAPKEDEMVDVSWDAIAQPPPPPHSRQLKTRSVSNPSNIVTALNRRHSSSNSSSNSRSSPALSQPPTETRSSCLSIRVGHHPQDTIPMPRRSSSSSTGTGNRSQRHSTSRVPPPSSVSTSSNPPPPCDYHSYEDEDNASSEYVDWPGTQDARGRTIPMTIHNDDGWIPPSVATSAKQKNAENDDPHNRTMNTSATTTDSSFQSDTDFFMGARMAEQQTKLEVFDAALLQQPIPLKRSVDSISIKSGKNTTRKSLSFQLPTTTADTNVDTATTTNNHYMKGYRGFIEKTKDVPSLFDTTADSASEATTTTTTTATATSPLKLHHLETATPASSRGRWDDGERRNESDIDYKDFDTETYVTDVFDGISLFSNGDAKSLSLQQYHQKDKLAHIPKVTFPQSIVEEDDDEDQNNNDMNRYVRDHYHQKQSLPCNGGTGSHNSHATFQLITLPGMGITTIQTSDTDYRNRYTAAGSAASQSDIGSYHTNSTTMTPIPDVHKMLQSGRDHDSALHGIYGNIGRSNTKATTSNSNHHHDEYHNMEQPKRSEPNNNHAASDDQNSSCSGSDSQYSMDNDDPSGLYVDGDYLSEYYIKPSIMKKVLLKYRSISDDCTTQAATQQQYELLVDERKAFALLEMRSRIMEKDIERQLERRGGSFAVDDIVTTPYHRTAHRIRDAVIVSKAWRDGATISDVIHTALLTRRNELPYAIPRPCDPPKSGIVAWEAVRWLDDTDFIQYRCPSLGSRHMHGFEMFTIGDCQSILLKLTNERCSELRHELNTATATQINAEDLMKEEENENNNTEGMLTEAEMIYLSALEQVKTISKKLVAAEKSFALVRDRIRSLISRYETMLLKIEAGSFAGASSIVSYESSYYSEYDHKQFMKEERVWAKRAMRAEIRAEIAAREALLAKQRAFNIQAEKMREIEELRKKLDELQSENSMASGHEREKRALANVMSQHNKDNQSQCNKSGGVSNDKLVGVKQRFRERMAEKKRLVTTANIGMSSSLVSSVQGRAPLHPSSSHQNNGTRHNVVTPSAQHQAKRDLLWSAGEEMFQQMVFYERSLEAVVVDDTTRAT